jgi:hypothetical protein
MAELANMDRQEENLLDLAADGRSLEAQLDLSRNPQALYRQLNDQGHRLLNQALFEQLLVDREDVVVQSVRQTYTEPVRDDAARALVWRQLTGRLAALATFIWSRVRVRRSWWS